MKKLSVLLFAVFSMSLASVMAEARGAIGQEVRWTRSYCAWAPRDPSVCAARKYCQVDNTTRACAKYCRVNPQDVVCGEFYNPTPRPTPPWVNDSPYPWARSGGGFCRQNPWNMACQSDYLLWWE
ncbi:MAG: hypothetical protein KF802_00295 [Bdellovibrionaceae bacterium]|nr:hypothetical protein [Pseudobdellovibrionaceae bacterium]